LAEFLNKITIFYSIKGDIMQIPTDLLYTKDHEWVSLDGSVATVGITDFAQGELGDIVYIDIPEGIEEIKTDDSFGTIEAVKTVSELYSPVSGIIIAINNELNDNPEVVNNDPYGAGWMIKIELSDNSEIDNLLDADAYKSLVDGL